MTNFLRRKIAAFTLIELMIVVAIIGILASVAIPTFQKYIKKSKLTEVSLNLKKMYDGESTYFYEEHTDTDGAVIPKQFVKCDMTPDDVPGLSKQPGNWNSDGWQAIKFASDSPVLYQYSVDADSGLMTNFPNFAAQSRGDIDGDGETSLFYRMGEVRADGQVHGFAQMISIDEHE